MGILKIEQIGGLAGIGDAFSALQRVGEFDEDSLTAEQKRTVDRLFEQKRRPKIQGADRTTFQLSRRVEQEDQMVIVAEDDLPQALQAGLSLQFR